MYQLGRGSIRTKDGDCYTRHAGRTLRRIVGWLCQHWHVHCIQVLLRNGIVLASWIDTCLDDRDSSTEKPRFTGRYP